MFFKQYNYRPRAGSQSSQSEGSNNMSDQGSPSTTGKGASSSHNSQPGATRGGAAAAPTPATNTGSRRKSSSGSFSALENLKRGGDEDPLTAAKKASFMEQKPGTSNPITNMWNTFTKGPTGAG